MTSPSMARIVGMLTFFIGVLLLLWVFFEARTDLTRPLTGNAATMGIDLARHVGLLFIMGYVGSSLAGRGVQLYGAAAVKAVAIQETVAEDEAAPKELPSTHS